MGWPQFLAWAATQGFKNIRLLRQAYNSFKKFPGKDVILKKAKNLLDDLIKKTPTKDIANKVRQRPIIPKEFNKFKTEIQTTRGMGDLWPRQLEKILKTGKYKKVPTPKHLTPKTKIKDLQIGPHIDKQGRIWPKFVKPVPKGPAKIIPFPKKPPGKADGGSIDKALPGRSRDI